MLHPRLFPHPQGQSASNDWLIQVQRPNPLTSIGDILNGHIRFRAPCKIGWDHCYDVCITNQLLFPYPGSLAPTRCRWDDSPVNLQVQISDSVSVPWGTQLATCGGNWPSFSISQYVAPAPHDHQKPCWVSLSLSRDPLHGPSLTLSPSPESVNAASQQNGHSTQESSSLCAILSHLVLVFTALTSL